MFFIVGLTLSNTSRRLLMLISQGTVTTCLLLMALYFILTDYDLTEDVRWLPLAILIVYFVFHRVGIATFVFHLTAEVQHLKFSTTIYFISLGVEVVIYASY